MIIERLQAAVESAARLSPEEQEKIAALLESAMRNALRHAHLDDPVTDSIFGGLIARAETEQDLPFPGPQDTHSERRVRCIPPGFEPYRYVLEVMLREDEAPKLMVIMKNPSTATAERSDATIGRVEAWARRNGYGSVACVNLFAWRATNPRELNDQPYSSIVGPENDRHILEAAAAADVIVTGWGSPNGIARAIYDRRINEILLLLHGYPLHVVGPLTQDGYPLHGRLWTKDCALADWRPDRKRPPQAMGL